ncbi:MAG: tetratricopeptide repeat protein [Spirochaetes bacterium]|nr:tetratricopeptide repeat protein [Spirochaetota bacterium]
MPEIKKKSHIEIERNPIERFLMYVKDFLKVHNRKAIYSAVIILVLFALSLTVYLLLARSSEKERVRLEIIIDDYNKAVRENNINAENNSLPAGELNKKTISEANNKAITELNNLISDTKYGFVYKICHYWLGNILFEEKRYGEAYQAFDIFIKKSSDDVIVPIAINKAAICLEEDGQIDNAITFLSGYVTDSKNKINMDQIYYNLGRLYLLNNNQIKARDSFRYVIDEYPESVYANRSRERLFLISAVK